MKIKLPLLIPFPARFILQSGLVLSSPELPGSNSGKLET